MPEPLLEEVEESWLEHMNRFDQVIYPTLFEPRGLTKAEAMLVWEMTNMRNELEELRKLFSEAPPWA